MTTFNLIKLMLLWVASILTQIFFFAKFINMVDHPSEEITILDDTGV